MEIKKIIFYIVLIIVILIAMFLSQQAYSGAIGKNLISGATSKLNASLAGGSNWVMSAVYPKIAGEVQSRGEIVQNGINQTEKNISEDITKKIGNYFSGIKNSILSPGNSDISCQKPTQASAPTQPKP